MLYWKRYKQLKRTSKNKRLNTTYICTEANANLVTSSSCSDPSSRGGMRELNYIETPPSSRYGL